MLKVDQFTDQNREVIYHILELLPTIREALQHMQLQLEELRMEESALLFQDTAKAIGKIEGCILPLINENHEQSLLKAFTDIRKSIALMIDDYDENNLIAIQAALTCRLIPAFTFWQQELTKYLQPMVLC